ncbi:hypothetical protein OI909_12460 [Enterobacter asburiae]|uniref:hypothetical protein n=1 Tax=Enterobacter asburiae TaxID=61645 RepID=UPI0025430E1E|nr:hypothetical protein [Enterobacter asburiae]WIK22284.1 hypothetical protein OI909_12460 [Enterobacter asburiae]
MSTITKEQAQSVSDLKAGYTLGHADVAILNELARTALASLEAEPVAWLLSGGGAKNNVSFDSGNAYADPLREVTPLYTAPPAPVSVPAAMEMDDDFDSAFEHGKAVGWNAYRAAMLQGADGNAPAHFRSRPAQSSLSPAQGGNSPVIQDGWVMVPVEPTEHMIAEGFESEPDKFFSDAEVWEAYDAMSGCQQAAHRAKLCWAAMIASAPKPEA